MLHVQRSRGHGVGGIMIARIIMRPPPNPEIVRRVCERRRAGESFATIARDAGVTEATARRWYKLAGEPAPPPAIMREPPPAPPDDPGDLALELERVAEVLDAAGGPELARVVRRAIDALRAGVGAPGGGDDDLPDPSTHQREWIVAMIARIQKSYARAEAAHNATAAKQYASALERWAARLKQYDTLHAASGDVITIPRAALGARLEQMREHVRALLAEPLRCAECGRRVRVGWAEDADEKKPAVC